MPREILEFRIVIASPSDVLDARKAAFDGIYELNRTLEAQRVSIRAMGWEEYVIPGIGSETQAVISDQLLRDYDILIAIFGTKLGTATANFRSGTVEEIEHAIANTANPMGHYRVQVYFLDKIESASKISIDELKAVSDFRKQLEPKGILYRLFKTESELQQDIRVNVQRSVLDYLRKIPRSTENSNATPSERAAGAETLAEPDDSAGLLDLQEEGEEALIAANSALNHISALMNEITEATNSQTSEIEKLSLASAKEKKKSINEYAAFLQERASALKKESFIARQNFSIFSQAVISLAGLQKQSTEPEQYQKDVAALLKSAEAILLTLSGTRINVEKFRTAAQNLPRITSQFNRSKRLLIEAIDECIDLIDQTERGMYQIAGGT